MEKEPSLQYKIRFIDCDPLGHLTNSRYLDYMLNAREDHVNQFYNLDYEKHTLETGNAWVAIQNQIAYLKEVKYNTEVLISSKTIQVDERKATIELLMKSLDENKVYAVLWTDVLYIDVFKKRASTHSPELMDMFQEVLVNLETKNFQERVIQLRKNN